MVEIVCKRVIVNIVFLGLLTLMGYVVFLSISSSVLTDVVVNG